MERRRPLSQQQARTLTDRIVSTPKERWARIAEAHARGAAEALGYPTWSAYCNGEFGPKRFRIAQRQRFRILTELKDAGMTFEDVSAVVMPQADDDQTPPALPPAPSPSPRLEDQLGFTPDELALIGALLEVNDEEFSRVLNAGKFRSDLSPAFVLDHCRQAVRRRDSLENTLDRALRAVERAQELLVRSRSTGTENSTVLDLIRLLEDQAWDLIDNLDRLHGQIGPAPETAQMPPTS